MRDNEIRDRDVSGRLLPALQLFPWLTLLPLLAASPLWWIAFFGEKSGLEVPALWIAAILCTAVIAANTAIWIALLAWRRPALPPAVSTIQMLPWLSLPPLLVVVPLFCVGVGRGSSLALWLGFFLGLVSIGTGAGVCLLTLYWERSASGVRRVRKKRRTDRRRRTDSAPSPETPETALPEPSEIPLSQVPQTGPSVATEAAGPSATETEVEVPAPRPASKPQPPRCDCVIDRGLWQVLKQELREVPNEQGGFVLGYRENGHSHLLAVVFPPNATSTGVSCEFPVEDIQLVREAVDQLNGMPGAEHLGRITAWIHTHPRLSVFLSGTDRETLKQWRSLDPDTRAVVVDPYQDKFPEQIGAFDGNYNRVTLEAAEAPLPEKLAEEFQRSLRRIYDRHGRPRPQVVLASADGQSAREELKRLLLASVRDVLGDQSPELKRKVDAALQDALQS